MILATFTDVGKMQTSIILLKLWYIKFGNISEFSSIILVGISSSCNAFEAPNFCISLITSSLVIWLKANTGPLLIYFLLPRYWDVYKNLI